MLNIPATTATDANSQAVKGKIVILINKNKYSFRVLYMYLIAIIFLEVNC